MLLLVNASPRGTRSESLALAEAVVRAYREAGGAEVDRIDVFEDVAPFGGGHARAKMAVIEGRPIPDDAVADWEQVHRLAGRVKRADTLVFAVPMWNGGIPWALKLFVDVVTQPGIAFRFDPKAGYSGLLGGRRAVTIYTSRVYAPNVPPAFGVDHHSSYLRWWLGSCGIDDVEELRLQPTFSTPDLADRRGQAMAAAHAIGSRLGSGRAS